MFQATCPVVRDNPSHKSASKPHYYYAWTTFCRNMSFFVNASVYVKLLCTSLNYPQHLSRFNPMTIFLAVTSYYSVLCVTLAHALSSSPSNHAVY